MYLVKFTRDWADEFDVHGFAVLTDEIYAEWQKLIKESPTTQIDWYFGTNEFYADETVEEFSESYVFTVISDGEAKFLVDNFGQEWGNFPDLTEITILKENE